MSVSQSLNRVSTNLSKPADTEARSKWYSHGEDLEDAFLAKVAPSLSLTIKLNPKKDLDPTVIDMLYLNKFDADLKTQNTPFFTATKYGVPPQYAVTFNKKDYDRYNKLYPFSVIFFWVHWTTLEWNGKRVQPMDVVYKVPFWKLRRDIESGSIKLHTYERRKTDKRANAKDSYVLDIRNYTLLTKEME